MSMISTANRQRTLSAPEEALLAQSTTRRPVMIRPHGNPNKKVQRRVSMNEKPRLEKRRKKFEGLRRNQDKQMRWELGSRFMK